MLTPISTYVVVNTVLTLFESTEIENTETNYITFVQKFAKENGMKIHGRVTKHGSWVTTGFEFNMPEDELIFMLKYGTI